MRNLIDMTIDVEPLRYGSFDVRIVEIGKHYECDLYIDNGEVECSMDIPTRDDKEDEEMQRRIIAAALEEYPGQIEGFNRFVNIECDGDYEYAIKTLLNRNGLVASGSLSNYNKRIKTNIEASPKDMFVHESLNKSVNETRDWDKWEDEWDRRKNSEFGKLLQKLEKEMFGMFGEYDEYGCNTTPITNTVIAYYDGANNLNKIVSSLEYTFENYDMLHHPHIKRIFNKLHKLANDNSSMNESLLGNFNIKNKTNRNIKIAFVPINSIKGYVEDVSDNKFLNLAATYGKVYSADDFNHIWNNDIFNFRPNNYYARIIY